MKNYKIRQIILAFAFIIILGLSLAACGTGGDNAQSDISSHEGETQDTEVATNEESHDKMSQTEADNANQTGTIDYVVKVAQSPGLCQAPIQIAVEKGFFEAEGLTVENVNVDAAHVQEALGADQVDAAQGLISKYLQPIENGLGVKFVAGVHTGCIKVVVNKDAGINSIEDLRGKKIGVAGLSDAATFVLERSLADAGIRFLADDDPEVELVVYNKNDLGQALENGAIDGIAANDPQVSQFEEAYDLDVLIDTGIDEKYKDEYCCAVVVTDKLYDEHPDAAEAFTRAILKASAWVSAHQEEAAHITLEHDYVAGEEESNHHLLETYDYIPSVQGGYDAVLQNVKELSAIGILKEGTDAESFADGAYAFFEGVPDSYSAKEAEESIGE